MGKSILAALISAGLLAEGAVPVANAATTPQSTKSTNNRSSGSRRARNTAIGAAGGAAGGAILGRGRGAAAGAVVGGAAGAVVPTRRRNRSGNRYGYWRNGRYYPYKYGFYDSRGRFHRY